MKNIIIGSLVKYKDNIYFVNNINNNLLELIDITTIDLFDINSNKNNIFTIKTTIDKVSIYENN